MKTFYEIYDNDNELWIKKKEYSDKMVIDFYELVKNRPNILSVEGMLNKKNNISFFSKSIWDNMSYLLSCWSNDTSNILIFGLECGICFRRNHLVFLDRKIGYQQIHIFNLYKELEFDGNIIMNKSWSKNYHFEDVGLLKEFTKYISDAVEKFDQDLQKEQANKNQKIEKEKEQLKESKNTIIQKLDTDNNGEIDLIDNDFPKLLSKYQKQIIGIDKNYIHQFVKVSNYIGTKKNNIQQIFQSIEKVNSKSDLERRINLIKNQIHTYELLIFHSLNMIEALVSEDLITFYEIYEKFDKIGIYNSNWENEVSNNLKTIGSNLSSLGNKLDALLSSIEKMEQNIVSEIGYMNYSTQESFGELNNSLSSSLKSINSSIDVNNLFTAINTYQLYKINKQTKSLLPKK